MKKKKFNKNVFFPTLHKITGFCLTGDRCGPCCHGNPSISKVAVRLWSPTACTSSAIRPAGYHRNDGGVTNEAAVCFSEASWGLNTQTATQTLLPAPDALWVPGGQFSSSVSVWARHRHTSTLAYTLTSTWHDSPRWVTTQFAEGEFYWWPGNPAVSLFTIWQPNITFTFNWAEETPDHDCVLFVSKHPSFEVNCL